MAIYLDANVLWSWRSFAEPERLALSIVARQLGQEVFVPSIAAREAEENYRRSLEEALEKVDKAWSTVQRLFETEAEFYVDPWPQVDETVETWRRRLEELTTILPLHDEDAHAAFDREITGTPPAKSRERGKPGRGGRDAAIWLTVARHHAGLAEGGHFVSKDGDMADTKDRLHARLRQDIAAAPNEVQLYATIEALLTRLGKAVKGREVTIEELSGLASGALAHGLRESLEVPHAVWDTLRPELRYSTVVSDARAVEILQQDRYEQGHEAVIAINARWELDVECCYQRRDAAAPELWDAVQQIPVAANVQVFLEERNTILQEGQLIGAQVTSETGLFFMTDGSVAVIGPAA
jgi:hypothetical protein